jgi:DNA-binding response OmpR family regulator
MNDEKKSKNTPSGNELMGVVMPFPRRKIPQSKTSVLVIDDDPQVLRVLLRILDPSLYSVRTAMTRDEALFIADIAQPDFILLDLHLSSPPRADGLACLKALREAGRKQPIFILSADASIEQAHEAARMGANGYLVKCDPEKFLDRLNKLLRQSVEESVARTLPPSAEAYFETRGLDEKDIALLSELTRSAGRVTEIAKTLNRADVEVQRQFQTIRERLGARNQVDLGRILGVLSCFAPIHERIY